MSIAAQQCAGGERPRGVLGNGRGLVRIKTVNGDIELRRAPR